MDGGQGSAWGRATRGTRLSSDWVGWTGLVTHPDSPLGGGGPGHFRSALASNDQLANPLAPSGFVAAELAGTPAPRPANQPPRTAPVSFSLFSMIDSRYEVDLKVEVIADGSGGVATGAATSFSRVPVRYPGYRKDPSDKITRFQGRLIWKGTITIQTRYATDATPKSLSCYGRGTTDADLQARNITLGFHESCHRLDFVAYLQAYPLPALPAMTVGMPESDFQRGLDGFLRQVDTYWKDMERDSEIRTDEVGFTKTAATATDRCQVHVLP
jgi:hypothetical protein